VAAQLAIAELGVRRESRSRAGIGECAAAGEDARVMDAGEQHVVAAAKDLGRAVP